MWTFIASREDFNTNQLSFASALMKFQQSNSVNVASSRTDYFDYLVLSKNSLEINILTIAGDTSIKYHVTKNCRSLQLILEMIFWALTQLYLSKSVFHDA